MLLVKPGAALRAPHHHLRGDRVQRQHFFQHGGAGFAARLAGVPAQAQQAVLPVAQVAQNVRLAACGGVHRRKLGARQHFHPLPFAENLRPAGTGECIVVGHGDGREAAPLCEHDHLVDSDGTVGNFGMQMKIRRHLITS